MLRRHTSRNIGKYFQRGLTKVRRIHPECKLSQPVSCRPRPNEKEERRSQQRATGHGVTNCLTLPPWLRVRLLPRTMSRNKASFLTKLLSDPWSQPRKGLFQEGSRCRSLGKPGLKGLSSLSHGPVPRSDSEAGSLEGWSNVYHWAEKQAYLQLAKESVEPTQSQ